MTSIYLDNNATTPIDPSVKKIIQEGLSLLGNPSSIHAYGQHVRNAISRARRKVAHYFGCPPSCVIFTSSGTEGMNLLLQDFLAFMQEDIFLPLMWNMLASLLPCKNYLFKGLM